MNCLLPPGLQYDLVLTDRRRWVIAAGDDEAATIVSHLGKAMQMRVASPSASLSPAASGTRRTDAVGASRHGVMRRLLVLVDAHNPQSPPARCHAPLSGEDDGSAVCILRSYDHCDGLYVQLMSLSLIFAHDAQACGGVLLHGALAERDGSAVILAAPGGTGKTTASERLPAPWRSLSDDTTLVVRDTQGNFRAHPWPTWSRFMRGEAGGTWDVQRAVPLKGVFFLSRAVEDRVESIGPGHAASLLVECSEQASQLMARGLSKAEIRALHLERFNNLSALARVVPAHVLHISLTGPFWEEIERALHPGGTS